MPTFALLQPVHAGAGHFVDTVPATGSAQRLAS
jgi:hypothetical protein